MRLASASAPNVPIEERTCFHDRARNKYVSDPTLPRSEKGQKDSDSNPVMPARTSLNRTLRTLRGTGRQRNEESEQGGGMIQDVSRCKEKEEDPRVCEPFAPNNEGCEPFVPNNDSRFAFRVEIAKRDSRFASRMCVFI